MARVEKDKNLRASILDRLMDDDPTTPTDKEVSHNHKLSQLRASVRRDLERLLNTRYRIIAPDDEYEEIKTSCLNYGLPDLATVNVIDIDLRQQFTKNVELIIRTFEPRFKSVKVEYRDNNDDHDRTLRFRIDAVLYADPAPEEIVFDSVLEPILRTVTVEESHHG